MSQADFQTITDAAARNTGRYHADTWFESLGPPWIYAAGGNIPQEALPQMDAALGSGKRNRYYPNNWHSVLGELPPVAHGSAIPMVELEAGRARRSLYNPNGWHGAGFELFGVTGDEPVYLLLGTTANGYGVEQDAFGNANIVKYVSGTKTHLATIALPNDNLYHTFKLSIIPGATNIIEASIDATKFAIQTDSSLTLTSGTWPVSMSGGAQGGARHFNAKMSVGHHTALPDTAKAVISSTADSNSSYLQHGTVWDAHIGGVKLDTISDGTSYKRVAAAEFGISGAGNTIGRLNDGTNIRTAAHVAGAIDTSSRIIGNIYDGTNSRSPANITTALDGSGRLIGNIYDGTNSRSPGNITTALDGSGRLIGSIYDGTNSRTPSSITATILSAGGIDFSSGLHTNKNLDNIADGSTWLRLQGVTGNKATWKSLLGDTSGDTTTSFVDGSNKRFLHTSMSTGVQTAIDASGNLLNISWTGISIGTGGAMSGFSSSGSSSSQALTLSTGQVISFEGSFKLAATTADVRFLLGNNTNGYGLEWTTAGVVRAIKIVSGTVTSLGTLETLTQDTNVHSFKVSVTVGATNTIEASFDASILTPVTDSGLTLTTGTWPFTIVDGNNGTTKLWNFQAYAALPHYAHLHSSAQAVVAVTADTNGSHLQHGTVYDAHVASVKLDTINDGTTYARVKGTELAAGTVKQLNDGTNTRTAGQVAGALDTSSRLIGNIYDGTNSRSPANITTALDGSGRLIGSIYDGTNSRTPASITATILSAGGIDFSSALHTNKTLDNIGDGTNYKRVAALEFASGGNSIARLNDGTYIRTALAIATNMDSGGNSKLNEFSAGGVTEGVDGSWTGVSSSGTTSTPVYTFATNAWVYSETHFALASTGNDIALIVGTTTNGYGLIWTHSDTKVSIVKWVSGTKTNLATILLASQTTNTYMVRLTVKAGSSTNTIEASFNNNVAIATDAVTGGLTLTSGSWGVTLLDGSNGATKFFHFDVESSIDHYTKLPAQAQAVVTSTADTHGSYLAHGIAYQEHIAGMTGTGNVNLDGMPDGTTYARVKGSELSAGTVVQLNDGTNVRTAAQVAGALDTSSRIIGSIYDGTNSRTPASITATILAAGGIDFSSALHTNKNLDNIADGSTYGRVKLTELSSNTVKQLNDGTNIRTASQVAAVLDTSSNLKVNPFGASSGVTVSNSNGALSGFTASTGDTTQQTYPLAVGVPITVSGTITLGTISTLGGIYLGNTTSGYGIEFAAAGGVYLVKYVSGTRTVLSTLLSSGSMPSDTKAHSYSLTAVVTAVGPTSTSLAAAFDSTTSGASVADGGFNPVNAGITVVAGGTGGLLQNFTVEYGMVPGDSDTIGTTTDTSGSYLKKVVYAQQINWASGTPTGSVSLDTVPDGTTYARVNATNLTSNNLNTPFNSTSVIWGTDGSLSGFPASAVSSTVAFPIKAAFPITFSGWVKLGGTTGSAFFLIGNETNGLGLRWNGSGLVSPVTIKAGTVTVGTTLVTVTRDTAWHWMSVKLTPGTTPGTSDVYVIYFDTNTVSTTSGSSAVTWGSTAVVTLDGGTVAGSSLLDHRISSNQP